MIKEIRCIGCGRIVGRNIKAASGWCYTCPCGGTLFEFDGQFSALPTSLVMSMKGVRDPPHIEYYLGCSDFMDERKKEVLTQLKLAGSVSFEECPVCLANKDKRREQMQDCIRSGHFKEPIFLSHRFMIPLAEVRAILDGEKAK